MKKRGIATIVAISVALVLIGSVSYAAGKKRQTKVSVQTPEASPEEEALAAELVAATVEEHSGAPGVPGVPGVPGEKVAGDRAGVKEGHQGG